MVVRKTDNKRKRREGVAEALAKTADENAAISASGPAVSSTNVPFWHSTYVAMPPPTEITSAVVGHMCAKKMDDPSSIDGTSKSAFCVYGLVSCQ